MNKFLNIVLLFLFAYTLQSCKNKSSDDEEDDLTITETEGLEITDSGKWVKREVVIGDSTRQVGNYVYGMEARVRVDVTRL